MVFYLLKSTIQHLPVYEIYERFITRDTWTYLPNDFRSFGKTVPQWMSDPQVFNKYSYCRNNPLKFIDPTGHGWITKLWSLTLMEIALLFLFIALCGLTGGIAAAPLALVILAGIAYAGTVHYFISEWFIANEEKGYKYHDLTDEKGERIGRLWFDLESGEIIGGYFWDGDSDMWMVYSSETGEYEAVSPDEWSPPDTEEPVTIEKFPPKDPDGDPPKEPVAGSSTGNSGNPHPIGPVARGNSII